MATEYKLSYTGSQINEKLNKIDSLATKSEIPTKVSQLTNDSGFITNAPVTSVNGRTGAVKLVADDINNALGYTPANVSDVFDYAEKPAFTNIFDTVEIEYGKLLNSNGTVSDTAAALATTGFIPVKSGDIIRVNEDFQLYCVKGASPSIHVYDSTYGYKTHMSIENLIIGGYYIELIEKNANGHVISFRINKPSTAAYIRICNHTDVIGDNPILTVGEEIVYEMECGEKLNPKIKVDYSQIVNSDESDDDLDALYETLFDIAEQPLFTNLLEEAGIEYGKCIDINNKTIEDTTANLATTGYIPVKAGDIIRVNEDFLLSNNDGTPAYILYDANKNALQALRLDSIIEGAYYVSLVESDVSGHHSAIKINKPSSTAYIRICNDSRLIGKNPILTVNEEIAYEMGYGEKLNPKIKVDYSQITNSPQKSGWSILPYERLNIAYSSINRKPINTVEHFTDAATNYGYNALKCDVRPTSDGELVCCHDAGFTFDSNGYITTYDSANSTAIRSVTAATCLGYSFKTGEHPCLVGDYLDVCRTYGKVAFITIRDEYMDVVIPKLLEELRVHNMTYSTIINCMTYNSLIQWRQQDNDVMINYTLNYGVAIDQAQIDKAVGLGYCSLCGFSLSSSALEPSASCDFEYARQNGIRLLQAIAYKEGSPEACYAMGYDGCQIGIPWNPKSSGGSVDAYSKAEIDAIMGSYITDINTLVGGDS